MKYDIRGAALTHPRRIFHNAASYRYHLRSRFTNILLLYPYDKPRIEDPVQLSLSQRRHD
jgi:hypothetical protein